MVGSPIDGLASRAPTVTGADRPASSRVAGARAGYPRPMSPPTGPVSPAGLRRREGAPDQRPLTFDGLRELLERFPRTASAPSPDQRRAAVSLTLLDLSTTPRVLVIKRVARGRNAGQWALPGGRLEPGEDAVHGALREASEEVGLGEARVAGLLDDLVAGSGFVITPVVVVAPEPALLTRNQSEVHSLHPIALERLLDDRVRRWTTGADGIVVQQLLLRHDMVVHPPTGAILWQFRELLLGRHTRVGDLVQPLWTHR